MKKVAFITGGSRGIGRAIAMRLAAEGYAVGIDYRKSQEQAEALVKELRLPWRCRGTWRTGRPLQPRSTW